MDNIEKQKEHFNSIALEYYSARQNSNTLLYKQLLWHYVFKHIIPSSERVSVLEPMCGYAEGENIVKSHYCSNIEYTGFDYSENIIDIAKQMHPGKKIFIQDVTTFRPVSKYDLIIIIGGLHHVPDYSYEVLRNLRDGLLGNGYLINAEPTHGNIIAKVIRDRIYRSNPIFDHLTERDYSVDELNKIYSDAGFEIVYQFYPSLLAYSLYSNPDVFPRLARINPLVLKILFVLEKPFYRTKIAKFFSFGTITILKRKVVID